MSRTMTDQRMRRSTAVKQVAGFVERVQDFFRRAAGIVDPTLVELWVGGAILENVERIDTYDVVLVLKAPADEVPWLVLHRDAEWFADELRLTKLGVAAFVRSTEHRVHNHRLRELVRVWTLDDGPDDAVIDRLRSGTPAPTDISRPPDDATLAAQLETELAQCRHYLAAMLDNYHDPDWRHAHKGFGVSPEEHLWRAAQAVRELTDALAALRT
jgi:hypothetical protein